MVASLAYTDPIHFFSSAFLTCQQGTIFTTQRNLTHKAIQWNALNNVRCNFQEMCQETLLLIDVGAWAVQIGRTPEQSPGAPALDGVP